MKSLPTLPPSGIAGPFTEEQQAIARRHSIALRDRRAFRWFDAEHCAWFVGWTTPRPSWRPRPQQQPQPQTDALIREEYPRG